MNYRPKSEVSCAEPHQLSHLHLDFLLVEARAPRFFSAIELFEDRLFVFAFGADEQSYFIHNIIEAVPRRQLIMKTKRNEKIWQIKQDDRRLYLSRVFSHTRQKIVEAY